MRNKTILTVLFLLFIVFSAHAASYDRGQTELLNLAYEVGKSLPHPELLQVIMMNETVAGRWGRHGDKNFKNWKKQSYGIMQVQLYTAKLVLRALPEYKFKDDRELRIRLQYDDLFNLKVACVFVKDLLAFNKGDYFKTILSYNVGPGNVRKFGFSFDPNGYVKKARSNLIRMMKFNARQGNGCIIKHTIKRGDTLSKLAGEYLHDWKRWKEILRSNSGLDPRNLKIGDTIYINV